MRRKTQLDDALILKEIMTAKLLELKYRERASELCTTSGIEKMKADLLRKIREGLLGIPDRMTLLTFEQKEEMTAEFNKFLPRES